jgi:hypothetical protein
MKNARYERRMKALQRWKSEQEKLRLMKYLKWRKAMRELRTREWRQEAQSCSN